MLKPIATFTIKIHIGIFSNESRQLVIHINIPKKIHGLQTFPKTQSKFMENKKQLIEVIKKILLGK